MRIEKLTIEIRKQYNMRVKIRKNNNRRRGDRLLVIFKPVLFHKSEKVLQHRECERSLLKRAIPWIYSFTAGIAALILSFILSNSPAFGQTFNSDASNRGYNCLFMGHSFFAPVANYLSTHARLAGFDSHRQMVVPVGGIPGTAGELWKSRQERVVKAKELIQTGNVDIIGLTYHPDGGSGVADYSHWVELALRYNPNTSFLIQAPWAFKKNKNLAEFEKETEKWHDAVHKIIDELRQNYPETRFTCIPQGRWMVELWRLFDAGKIPELTVFVAQRGGDRRGALFGDQLGHAGILPLRTGALLWLAVIYNFDLSRYAGEIGTAADLKSLAQKLVYEDPYCGVGNPDTSSVTSVNRGVIISAGGQISDRKHCEEVLSAAVEFDAGMYAFIKEHGYDDFLRHIGSYTERNSLSRAQKSGDRLAPRRTIKQFESYAGARLKECLELRQLLTRYTEALSRAKEAAAFSLEVSQNDRTGLSQACVNLLLSMQNGEAAEAAKSHHDGVVRLFEGILAWLQVNYALIIQDARLCLAASHLLFEGETDARWKTSYSPGCFSLLVRARDIEVLEEIARKILDYELNMSGMITENGLVPGEQKLLLESFLSVTSISKRQAVKQTLFNSLKNPLELVYWHYVLSRFRSHDNGMKILGRVWLMSSRRGIDDSRLLYERMRESAFPGNGEAIWPRMDMSRFDARIQAIADRAMDISPLKEFEAIQEQIHTMVKNGVLRGGGIAEHVLPLGLGRGGHGMNHFLDFGVGGCEAFSSFVTAPMLSLGNNGVHPVFISRPWQPWGHWVAGLDFNDTLYFCDGANINHKPPVPLEERVSGLFNSAGFRANRYLGIRVYSQTLASWEWEWMLHGSAKWQQTQRIANPVYSALTKSRLKNYPVGAFKLENAGEMEMENLFQIARKCGE